MRFLYKWQRSKACAVRSNTAGAQGTMSNRNVQDLEAFS